MVKKFPPVLKSYLLMTLGSLFMAVGIYFFKFPNHFSTGGVSALSILLTSFFPQITPSQFMLAFKLLLLVVGFLVFGKGFAFKTVYCSVSLSIFTRLLEIFLPLTHPLTGQKFLELIFAIGLTAVGSAILFNENASSGGTDIVAMILKKYTRLDIGKSLLCSDFLLAAASIFVFDMETGLFSLLGLAMKAFVVDNVIDSINLTKCFFIVTEQEAVVCDFIQTQLHRGATVSACTGAFSGREKRLILTVLPRGQAIRLKQFLRRADPGAFSIITSSSDILGKGFRTVL